MKSYVTEGTGSQQTLRDSQDNKIPIYDSLEDVEADLANLSVGQIVATKDTGDELAQPVNVVESGNLHAVSSNAVAESLSYSTTEHKTGKKWIDGKLIYERTFEYTNKNIIGGTWLLVDVQFPISHTNIIKGESLFICTQFSISLDWFIEGSELKVYEVMASRTGTVLLSIEYTKD